MADVPIPSLSGSDLVSDVDDQFRDLVAWLADALALDTSGLLSISAPAQVGTIAALSSAILSAVGTRNMVEWGHLNTAGYRCVLGAEAPTGKPFIAFNAEAGTADGTYRTRGKKGVVVRSNLDGTLTIGVAATANADNQTLDEIVTITDSTVSVSGDLIAANLRAISGGLRRPDDAGNAILLDNGVNTSYGNTRLSDAAGSGEGALTFGPSDHRPFRGLITGYVHSDGTILGGSGFTVSHTPATGIYNITFAAALPTPCIPVVTMGLGSGPGGGPQTQLQATTGFQARTYDLGGSLADRPFTFIATPR